MALGRTKSTRRQKETNWHEEQVAEADQELDSYLAALAPEEDVETTGSGRRFGGSQVYQLRLPLIANERLKELAAKQGTSPAALARDWVLQHLSEGANPAPSSQPAVDGPEWPDRDFGQETQPGQPAQGDNLFGQTEHSTALSQHLMDPERTDEITMPHGRLR